MRRRRKWRRRKRGQDLTTQQPGRHIERLLREDAAEQEATQNIRIYKGFCVHRYHHHNSRPIHTTMLEEEEDRIASRKPMVLEFISILCEHIIPLSIKADAERYDFSSVSGVEIPVAIELPKYMTIQSIRLPPSQQDAENTVRRIQTAVGDLDVREIQAGWDPLSELLPVGGWHYVKSRLKVINFEKDYIYEEYSPQPCGMPSCPICIEVAAAAAKKGKERKEKRLLLLEQEIEKKHSEAPMYNDTVTVKKIEERQEEEQRQQQQQKQQSRVTKL
jgi:hypothetical protein